MTAPASVAPAVITMLSHPREISRFPCKKRLHMPGAVTTPDRPGARDIAPVHVAFHLRNCVGIRDDKAFVAQWAGLCSPLPTLRRYSHRHLRTARGRCGPLFLHRKGLAPSTSCRFHRRTQQPFMEADKEAPRRRSGSRLQAGESGRAALGLLAAWLRLG
jgi:hypothetical protein